MTARFIRRGVSKILYVPTVANVNSVTRAELTAATDLTPFVAEVNGWMLQNNSVATPDLSTTFETSIPGTDQVSDSSLSFYEDLDDETIETLVPAGSNGFIILLRKGDKPGTNSLDCFPTRVASKGSEFTTGNDPARFTVTFTVTSRPGLDGLVPAGTAAAPVITSIAPASVAAVGEDQAVITGVGFTGATAVTVDGVAVAAADWTVISETKIAFVTPAHAAGAVPVTVTNASGTSAPSNITYA